MTDSASWREWLRSEQRLGVSHWAVPPDALAAPQQPPPSEPPSARTAPTPGAVRPGAPAAAYTASPPARPAASPPRPAAPPPAAVTPMMSMMADESGLPPLCTTSLSENDVREQLKMLDRDFVRPCKRCGLHNMGRQQTVFGVGNPRPELVFVGEGPGADEDREGVPFVGKAGQLLTRMIAAMTLTRDQVYICNVVKCRPPENRTPTEEEMAACSPHLFRQLALLRPRIIVALGRPATQTLLATKASISALRGRWHDFPPPAYQHLGLPPARLMPTFHPAYLLRSPNEKGKAWDDLKQVMGLMGIPVPGAAPG